MRGLSDKMRDAHFKPDGSRWRLRDSLVCMVTFQRRNLMQPLDAGLFDIIFCRNVTIYFDAEDTRRVLHGLVESMRPGGHLFTGHAESFQETRGRAAHAPWCVFDCVSPLEEAAAARAKPPAVLDMSVRPGGFALKPARALLQAWVETQLDAVPEADRRLLGGLVVAGEDTLAMLEGFSCAARHLVSRVDADPEDANKASDRPLLEATAHNPAELAFLRMALGEPPASPAAGFAALDSLDFSSAPVVTEAPAAAPRHEAIARAAELLRSGSSPLSSEEVRCELVGELLDRCFALAARLAPVPLIEALGGIGPRALAAAERTWKLSCARP